MFSVLSESKNKFSGPPISDQEKAVTVPIDPDDFKTCPDCGKAALLVAFWDPALQEAREKLVRPDFFYHFPKRDFKNRLVVHEEDRDQVMAASHHWTCPAAPPAPPPAPPNEDETKPFQGPRSHK